MSKNDICARCGSYVGMLGPKYTDSSKDNPLCPFCYELVIGYEKMQENGLGVIHLKYCKTCHKLEGIHFLSGRKSIHGPPPKQSERA